MLTDLPKAFGQLSLLTVLSLSGNRFNKLPPVLFELTWLKVLHALEVVLMS